MKFSLDFRQSFWSERTEIHKEKNYRVAFFLFPMINVLYGIYVYRMYLPCDVNKMNDKKSSDVPFLKVYLSITVYVLLFCPFKTAGCVPKLY